MRRRILATIVIVTTVAVTLVFIPAALAIRSRIQRGDVLELQREAAIVANEVTPSGPIDVDELAQRINSDHDLALYDELGRRVAGEGPEIGDRPVVLAIDGSFAEGYIGDELVAAVPLRAGPLGVDLVVRISGPRRESHDRIVNALARLAAVALAIIAAAALVGWLLARRLSRPIEELQRVAGAIGDGRFDGTSTPTGIAELDELARTLDDSRSRIAELLGRERAFSSHVSHQLRTPVATMRVAIETELTAPRPDSSAVLHESLGALDRLESTIASMLELARHDVGTAEIVDLLVLARRQLRSAGSRSTPGTDATLVVSGSPARPSSSKRRSSTSSTCFSTMPFATGAAWSLSACEERGSRSCLTVRDEGELGDAADPFSERRSDSGHGIGLRLARTLAESEGGVLTLECRAPTTFTLTFRATTAEEEPSPPSPSPPSSSKDE